MTVHYKNLNRVRTKEDSPAKLFPGSVLDYYARGR